MMNIEIIPCLNDNYSYIIQDEKTNLVGVVDPSDFYPIDRFLSKKYKKLDYILNTHHHFDHIGGNEKLKSKYNSKIVGSKIDYERIPGLEILLNDDSDFIFGNIKFKIIFVPGHTSGHIAFYSEQEKIVFTGDTLFSLGCGRLFEGTAKQMFSSLLKIKNLPGETQIFCGHEYTNNNLRFCLEFEKENEALKSKRDWIKERLSNGLPTIPVTLNEELKTNIFLRCDNIEIKKDLKMTGASDELVFEKLRNLKDNF